MASNQRESFRVEADFDAELFHEGRVAPCRVINLSAGGARVETALEMRAGAHCTLGLRLDEALRQGANVSYVSFHMEVLETIAIAGAELSYRLRNVTGPGSREYETAARLVFAQQRKSLASESGADDSSPMANEPPRRRRFGLAKGPRFSKKSMRPGSND